MRPWIGLRQQHLGQGPCPPGGPLGAEGLGRAVHAFHDQDQVVCDRRRVSDRDRTRQLAGELAEAI